MIDLNKEISFLTTRRFHWMLIISCSVFFVLFLLFFLPFGVNEPQKEFNLLFIAQMSLFGWIIFFTLVANEFLVRRRFFQRWTFKVFLWWVAWMIFTAGTMNFLLYNYLQNWYDMYWSSYFLHVINVGMVLVFPVTGVFYYFRHREMQRRLRLLREVKETSDILKTPVTFTGSSERERITLELQQFLYVESDDNYVVLHYLDNGKHRKHVMRSTLSAMEKADFPVDFLLRIHRSFLVNAFLVESLRGNVQKSELKLRHLEVYFPVSRRYVHAVRATLAG